jgi:type II pantothenate kinase
MEFARRGHLAQQAAMAKEMLLTDDLVQRAGPHSVRQRLSRRPFRPEQSLVCVGFAPCHLVERITSGGGGLKWLAPPPRGWHLRCGPARFYLLDGPDRSRHPIMIVGIDIGGSTTDAVILDNGGVHVVTIEANDPVAAAAGALGKLVESYNLPLNEIACVAATGAGSRALSDTLFGRPVVKVNEFTAIGIGGTSLAGVDEALVVSLGTGTAIVSVKRDKIEHVSGTGLGGGTLRGLSRHMLGVSSLETLEAMAARGDLSRVDLTVRDIAGGAIGDLPPGTTAANFGKITADATSEDKALAIMNMIVEVVSVLSLAAARASGQRDIVLTGKLTRIFRFMERMKRLNFTFGSGFQIPEHADYATAIGAARAAMKQ